MALSIPNLTTAFNNLFKGFTTPKTTTSTPNMTSAITGKPAVGGISTIAVPKTTSSSKSMVFPATPQGVQAIRNAGMPATTTNTGNFSNVKNLVNSVVPKPAPAFSDIKMTPVPNMTSARTGQPAYADKSGKVTEYPVAPKTTSIPTKTQKTTTPVVPQVSTSTSRSAAPATASFAASTPSAPSSSFAGGSTGPGGVNSAFTYTPSTAGGSSSYGNYGLGGGYSPYGATDAGQGEDPYSSEATDKLLKAYLDSIGPSDEEKAAQEKLDKLTESASKTYVNTENQAIPMPFITGQLMNQQKQTALLSQPLQAQMAALQASRTQANEANKFLLGREDERLASLRENATKNGFTLNQGETRYDAQGRVIASSEAKADAASNPQRMLTPTEASALGVPYGTTAGQAYGVNPVKTYGADTAKVLGIATTVVPEINQLKQVLQANYRGALTGIVTGTDRNLVKLVDQIADKIGRLRSGGAINKDEEMRFKRQVASLMDIPFGDAAGAIAALDGLIAEANQVAGSIQQPQGGYSSSGSGGLYDF